MRSIETRLRSIESKRIRLLEAVAGIDAAGVAARPRPDKWSIQELVEHLVLAETDVFGALDELEQTRPLDRTPKNRVLYWLIMFILRFDIPVKVPSAGMIPEGGRSIEQLGSQWEKNHQLLRAWVESVDQRVLVQPRFTHPVAGPMTTGEALRMLEVHLDRHFRQVKSIIKNQREAMGGEGA